MQEEGSGWRTVYRCRQNGRREQSSTVDNFFFFFITCIMVCVFMEVDDFQRPE